MAINIDVDIRDFAAKTGILADKFKSILGVAVQNVADEVMRLSQFEVPHDTGLLQNSGHVESVAEDEAIVGYNKVYAARLHEHPEYHFQAGRKGKYLEDPIKNNIEIFRNYFGDTMSRIF